MNNKLLTLCLIILVSNSQIIVGPTTSIAADVGAISPVLNLQIGGPFNYQHVDVKPCKGYSQWLKQNVGTWRNTVNFRFEARYNNLMQCKHYFTLTSKCIKFQVIYETIHSYTSSITVNLIEITQPALLLPTCQSQKNLEAQMAIVGKFKQIPSQIGYQYWMNFDILDWESQRVKYESGKFKVWFL